MSGSGNRPIGKACAILSDKITGGQAKFIELGPVWKTKTGKLMLTMEVEPLAWKDPFVPRTILIQPYEEGVFVVAPPTVEKTAEKIDHNPEGGGGDLPF